MKVLIVDDDPAVRDHLRAVLSREGMEAHVAVGAGEARTRIQGGGRGAYDLLLVDLKMPGVSGWELLEGMRESGDETPVIVLTGAFNQVEDRVRGLRLGADDYLPKPYAPDELVARVQAVVRRRRALPVLELGELRIDLGRRTVERGGARVAVSPREFLLLAALVEARGEVLSRRELLQRVWGIDFLPDTNVLEVQVARLRRKLERAGPPLIETLVGRGYRIRTLPAQGPPPRDRRPRA